MKKVNFLSVLLLAFVQVSFGQFFTSSFETWSNPNSPTGWLGSQTHTTDLVVNQSTDAQDGAFSCQLVTTGSAHRRFTSQPLAVTAGTVYTITFYVKGAGEVRTGLASPPFAVSDYIYNAYVAGTSTWTQHTQNITAPVTTDAQFIFSVRNTVGPTHILIDNVTITTATVSLVPIYDIQFTTATDGASPLVGQTVSTRGMVTGVWPTQGFFIQDGTGPWRGIFVFNSTINPSMGDSIALTGNVVEFFGLTQISSVVSHQIVSTGNPLPAPAVITTAQANTEQYESVLVRVQNAICTNNNAGFGMFRLNNSTADMLVDDDIFAYTAVVGNGYNAQGLMWFSFGEFKMLPRMASDIELVGFASLSDNELNAVAVYPNPATNEISVVNYEGQIQISDALGRIVKTIAINTSNQQIDINSLESGVYFVVANGQAIRFVKK